MWEWVGGVKTLILDPETFFREEQEERCNTDRAVTFALVAAIVLAAIRYTLTPAYPHAVEWFRPVMANILMVPGILYVVIFTSLFAQGVLSLRFGIHRGEDRSMLSTYQRTLAVCCYSMVFPALLLWFPPLLPWMVLALPAVFLIAVYTAYNTMIGLSMYHNLPQLAAALEQPDNIPEEYRTAVKVLGIGLVILFLIQFTVLGIPEHLF